MEILIEDKIKALIESQYSLVKQEVENNSHDNDNCSACKLRRDFDQLDSLMKTCYLNFYRDFMQDYHPVHFKLAFLVGFQLALEYRDILDMEKSGLIQNNEVNQTT